MGCTVEIDIVIPSITGFLGCMVSVSIVDVEMIVGVVGQIRVPILMVHLLNKTTLTP